jgi:hypothetical protein
MAGLSRLYFDRARHDFIINGQPLLAHLAKHEGINASMYQPAFGVQPYAAERLRGEAEPDLAEGHVALYVCGMCGDYDGSPIGVRVVVDDPEVVSWEELGWHDSFDGWHQFSKVRGYRFGRADYFDAFRGAAAT